MRELLLSLLLAVPGCGAQCFDCRDAASPCLAGQACKETEVLPTSGAPGAMHYTAWQCRDEAKK